MAKQTVSAKAVAADIRSGLSNPELMEKYNLSAKGLDYLFEKLIEKNVVTAAELPERREQDSKTVRLQMPVTVPEPSPPLNEHPIHPQMDKATVGDDGQGRNAYGPVRSARPAPTGANVARTPMANAPDGKCCDWDDYWRNTSSLGIFSSYWRTVTRCLKSPARFFSKLPLDYGYWSPASFGIGTAAGSVALSVVSLDLLAGGPYSRNVSDLIVLGLSAFFVWAIVASLDLFAESLILHGCLLLLGGVRSGYQATFRVVSYSCVANLFGAIPVIGLLSGLLGLYLKGIGLRETHGTITLRAFGAVLIPFILLVSLLFIAGAEYTSAEKLWQAFSAARKPASLIR